MSGAMQQKPLLSPYLEFDAKQWQHFRQDMPLVLTEADLGRLQGQNEAVSLDEIESIYLPLARLLNLYVSASQSLHRVSSEFLGCPEPKVPYIIGVSGSVAVGKSTTSRVLQALLSRWPEHRQVVIVPTDGFLFPNAELEKQGLMSRKGFPESYDALHLLQFLQAAKSGKHNLRVPVYSHHCYDIVPDQWVEIDAADIIIVEGLNILQTGLTKSSVASKIFVSDYFDFSIFVDAQTAIIKQWYIDRVFSFCQGPFRDPKAYFHYLSTWQAEEIKQFASKVWHEINELNLTENILPFRERASCILTKGLNHCVERILLRKL